MWINGDLNQIISKRTSSVNGQDQIVQSGNYCYSSIRVASIDEEKIYKNIHRKTTMTLIQARCPNHIAFHASKQSTHSAEVRDLVPVFKKSTIEPKQNLDANT